LPHLVSRLDFARSDFFVFGYLKEKLTPFSCTTRDELKSAIIIIFDEIDKEILRAVFNSWFDRFEWVIGRGGESFNQEKRTCDGFMDSSI
jgi:hypothetical protein